MSEAAKSRILARIHEKLEARALARAYELRDIVVNLHVTAPRRGPNKNAFGLLRSGANPPQAPAVEYGSLLMRISGNPRKLPRGYRIAVNRKHLEYGTRTMAPRPMGKIGIATLFARRGKVRIVK